MFDYLCVVIYALSFAVRRKQPHPSKQSLRDECKSGSLKILSTPRAQHNRLHTIVRSKLAGPMFWLILKHGQRKTQERKPKTKCQNKKRGVAGDVLSVLGVSLTTRTLRTNLSSRGPAWRRLWISERFERPAACF